VLHCVFLLDAVDFVLYGCLNLLFGAFRERSSFGVFSPESNQRTTHNQTPDRRRSKYKKNKERQTDGTAQHATNKSTLDIFSYETRVQEILTDKQTGLFKTEKFRNFMQTF